METELSFSNSAFKHGCTEADIEWAFETKQYDSAFEEKDSEDVSLLLGFDCKANLRSR